MITSAPVRGRTNQIGNWSKPGSTQTESEEMRGSSASTLVDYARGLGIRPRNARRLVAYYLQNLAAEVEFGVWVLTYADPTGETAVRQVDRLAVA